MAKQAEYTTPLRRALPYALIYAALGVVWVALSDRIVIQLTDDPATVTLLHTAKGWIFIGVSTILLCLILWRHARVDEQRLAESRRQKAEIEHLNNFQRSVIETPQVWINTLNSDAEVTLWNHAAEQISGYSREEVLGHTRIWEWLYPDPDYRRWIAEKAEAILKDGVEAARLETRIRAKNGEERDIEWHSRPLLDPERRVTGAVAFGVDVTRMKIAQQALHARERELSAIMANLPGMAYRCRDDGAYTMSFVSRGCQDLTGYSAEELLAADGPAYRDLIIDKPDLDSPHLRARIQANESFALEYRIRQRDGRVAWALERGCAITLDDERYLEGIVVDITERKEMEQELHHLASHDQLTGLYNRRTMDQHLRDELARSHRYGRPLSLLWLDLDHFKAINDRYGHQLGDLALQHVSQRLRDNLRTTDYLARYGGEELIVALPELDLDEALQAAERLRRAVAETPFQPGLSDTLQLTVSLGVASRPYHGDDLETLYRAADNAMYRSKETGRNRVSYLDPISESGRGE